MDPRSGRSALSVARRQQMMQLRRDADRYDEEAREDRNAMWIAGGALSLTAAGLLAHRLYTERKKPAAAAAAAAVAAAAERAEAAAKTARTAEWELVAVTNERDAKHQLALEAAGVSAVPDATQKELDEWTLVVNAAAVACDAAGKAKTTADAANSAMARKEDSARSLEQAKAEAKNTADALATAAKQAAKAAEEELATAAEKVAKAAEQAANDADAASAATLAAVAQQAQAKMALAEADKALKAVEGEFHEAQEQLADPAFGRSFTGAPNRRLASYV